MHLAIVTDFDGTLTREDVGNELCIEACPELFKSLHAELKAERMTLKDYQQKMWSFFPMPEKLFRERARVHGKLRDGVIEFLEESADQGVPVYVASCGLRPYIEEVLNANLPIKALKAVTEIRCNEARFGPKGIEHFEAPLNVANSPWPLDKGYWAQEIKTAAQERAQQNDGGEMFVVGIGNGTSDRSLCGKVDLLLATDGLARFCDREGHAYMRFDNFFEVSKILEAFAAKVR